MFLLQRGHTALTHPCLLEEPFFPSSSMKLDLSSLVISFTFNIFLLMFCLCVGVLFWPQPGKFTRRSLNQTYGEPGSDWLFKTISTQLSQRLQHKSDLLSVINDLSQQSSIQIPDDSKQHLSKSSCSTLEPTTNSRLPLSPSKLTTSCAANTHACAHKLDWFTCASLAFIVDEDENWEHSPGRGNSYKVLKESSILICNFGTHIPSVRGQR